ncbi:MAG: ComEC/Rec2 family competence protein [Candidatus Gracilibacteria bacterium]
MSTLKFFFAVLVAVDVIILASLTKMWPYLRVDFLDIGQGDSVLVTTAEKNHILIDGGPGRDVLSELPSALPYLFNEIDLMVLTHPHDDHIEGLIPLLERVPVGAILFSAPAYKSESYDTFLRKIDELKIPMFFAEAGVDFKFGDTFIDVLYPSNQTVGEEFSNINNSSVILRISDGKNSVLLTGDADESVEAELVDKYGASLKADIFKAGHHGSKYSNTADFLDAVIPNLVVISVGEGNDYGHPHEEVLGRLNSLGIDFLRTDLKGTVSIIFDDCLASYGERRCSIHSLIRSIFAPSLRSFSSSFS